MAAVRSRLAGTVKLHAIVGGRLTPRAAVQREETARRAEWSLLRQSFPGGSDGCLARDVLSIGDDEGLLYSRELVFHSAGYSVRSLFSHELLAPKREAGSAKLAVICHSLPDGVYHECVRALRVKSPFIEIVQLATWSHPDAADRCAASPGRDGAVQSLSDPHHLLQTVARLIGPARG